MEKDDNYFMLINRDPAAYGTVSQEEFDEINNTLFSLASDLNIDVERESIAAERRREYDTEIDWFYDDAVWGLLELTKSACAVNDKIYDETAYRKQYEITLNHLKLLMENR